ncbi:hypothetical protein C8J57DRAFT_1727274 [Mycena rebaudengoi]|nr:hypothetical protein C8J57DRAFT_1727274 [Mycena rebaudengoi]
MGKLQSVRKSRLHRYSPTAPWLETCSSLRRPPLSLTHTSTEWTASSRYAFASRLEIQRRACHRRCPASIAATPQDVVAVAFPIPASCNTAMPAILGMLSLQPTYLTSDEPCLFLRPTSSASFFFFTLGMMSPILSPLLPPRRCFPSLPLST